MGLAGSKDAELLNELDKREIDIFITIDGKISINNNLSIDHLEQL